MLLSALLISHEQDVQETAEDANEIHKDIHAVAQWVGTIFFVVLNDSVKLTFA
eukprot:m.10306 g.10306  ORF g.10306 m.10306 type:complete len:53 (-) comp4298_c0_seq2:1076-1234(-)